jgi:hypothetical protein
MAVDDEADITFTLAFQAIIQENHPRFDDRAFIWHIIQEIEIDNWPQPRRNSRWGL